jgi:SAM-dependent methyltransferase
MDKKYKYSAETANAYKTLGIAGTTYEPSFQKSARILGDLKGKVVLDFGSGAGRSARFLINLGAKKVIGVDHNASMVEEAKGENISGAEFHLVENTFPLPDYSVDLVFSSHALMEISEIAKIQTTMTKIARVVKQEGRFIAIIANPESAFGHDYVSYRYPDKPKTLRSGDKINLIIKTSKPFVIEDHYWTLEDYKTALGQAGFLIQGIMYPKPESGNWIDEIKIPAHMILDAVKK